MDRWWPESWRARGCASSSPCAVGTSLRSWWSRKRLGIRVVDVRHEVNAVFAADAVARLTGVPGVAAVTAGPGVTNTVTALQNAKMAESPLVLLGGATPTLLEGRGALQDIDQLSLMRPLVKEIFAVDRVRNLAASLERAFRVAQEGVPGPVFVQCPVDLLYDEELVRGWYGGKKGKSLGARLLNLYLRFHAWRLFRGAPEPPATEEPIATDPVRVAPPAPEAADVKRTAACWRRRSGRSWSSAPAPSPTRPGPPRWCWRWRPSACRPISRAWPGVCSAPSTLFSYGTAARRPSRSRPGDPGGLPGRLPARLRAQDRPQGEAGRRRAGRGAALPQPVAGRAGGGGRRALPAGGGGGAGEEGVGARRGRAGPEWLGELRRAGGGAGRGDRRARPPRRRRRSTRSTCSGRSRRRCRTTRSWWPTAATSWRTASYVLRPRGRSAGSTRGPSAPSASAPASPSGRRSAARAGGLAALRRRLGGLQPGGGRHLRPPWHPGDRGDRQRRRLDPDRPRAGGDPGRRRGDDPRRTDYHAAAEGFGGVGFEIARPAEIAEVLRKAREAAAEGKPVVINAHIGRTDFRKGTISM